MSVAPAPRSVATRRPNRLIVLLLTGAAAIGAVATATRIAADRRPTLATTAKVDPRQGVAWARSRAETKPEALIFSGDRFPEIGLIRPARIESKLGPCAVRTTFYDVEYRPVEAPDAPGPYAAVVEFLPKGERPTRRYLTLYRTARPLPPEETFDPESPGDLADLAGIAPEAVERQKAQIARLFGRRNYDTLVHDTAATRMLAGLKLGEREHGPVRPWSNAPAAMRRWWLGWKRKVLGLKDEYYRPLIAPDRIAGPPAPTLREGTEAEAGLKPGTVAAIDEVLRAWADDSDQAFAVCIARDGVIVLHRAYGMRDGRPMTVKTKSWMASITKPMSATLMMMLVDRGFVGLDDRIRELLPPLRGLKADRPITVRHLYTHTHGLDFWLKGEDERPDFIERVADCYPSSRAGRAWIYGGTGYTVGGKIFENLTGEALPDAYRKRLLAPLGMDDTDVSNGHNDAYSVPLDIAKFGQMLLNRGSYGDQLFLRESTFRRMLPERLTTALGPDAQKVFGIGLDGTPDQFGHGATSSAIFQIRPSERLVVVMTRNAAGKNAANYHERFWQAIEAGLE